MAQQPDTNQDHAAEHEKLSQQYDIETWINTVPQDQSITLSPELTAFIQEQGQVEILVFMAKI